jgi:hypothetical protein
MTELNEPGKSLAHLAHRGWSTYREMDWLDNLGSHVPVSNRPVGWPVREILLSRYKATMHRRENWGRIDREKIAAYLEKVP